MNKYKEMSAIEMFPQLNNYNNMDRFIEFIKVDDLRLFCRKCLEKSNKKPTQYNNTVAEYVLDLMIRKELLTPENHQTYVDALLIAAQLFDIYYSVSNKDDYSTLFKARVEFDSIADLDCYEHGPLPEQFREMIWDTIEGQLGDCTPMSKTKPSPNTPQDLFATAVWITNKMYNNYVVDETYELTEEELLKNIAMLEDMLKSIRDNA